MALLLISSLALQVKTVAPHPVSPSTPVEPAAKPLSQTPSQGPSLTSDKTPVSTHTSSSNPTLQPVNRSSQLVRFDSPAAQSNFLLVNHLSPNDITALPQLNLYQLVATNIVVTDGTQLINNQIYHALLTPTDPAYSTQWYLPRINAPQAWDNQMGSASITIADIDTGFALNHEDLVNKWAYNTGEQGLTDLEGAAPNCTSRGLPIDKSCNNIDDDNDGFIDNALGWNFTTNTSSVQAGQTSTGSSATHGTLVSGLIAASANNAKGVSGVSWGSKVLPIQVLSDDGNGDSISVSLGVNYAVTHGAKIINLSLGSSANDPILAEQIANAIAHNVTVVAAAGNDGCDCLLYPARYPGVIAVGATAADNQRASFSSTGSGLTLVAPGTSSICSTLWTPANPVSAYSCSYNGTSFASPLVAGTASLLLSQNSSLTPADVKNALSSSATKLPGMNGLARTDQYGYGLLNVIGALTNVSLSTPQSIPLNTHSITSSATSDSRLYAAMNSTCLTNVTDAICKVRAINQATNQVVTLSDGQSVSNLNLYWNANVASLSPGSWLIQTYAATTTANSLVDEEVLTISP